MEIQTFINALEEREITFFSGVPDSQLSPLCNYLNKTYGIDARRHVVCANEGNCTAVSAGYHLATGKVPAVYMQNSGEGNAVNPIASLLNDKVYAIPCLFIIGWRGEPNVHDEPQHIYQGEITLSLLKELDIECEVFTKDTTEVDLKIALDKACALFKAGKQFAFVVKKGALSYNQPFDYKNNFPMIREEVLKIIAECAKDGVTVCTTGKSSRELYEIREANGSGHDNDFLTVGSMGHSSSIAMGIALNSDKKVWCIDGDGAVLMHMGAMAVMGEMSPNNLIHIVLNNGSHESVGGMPTPSGSVDFVSLALACGYRRAVRAESYESLKTELEKAKSACKLTFIEVPCAIGSRPDLGRPKEKPAENKQLFMERLKQ